MTSRRLGASSAESSIPRTEPDQVPDFRVRGRRAFQIARVEFDPYCLGLLPGGGAFIIAEVIQV
jgi:hypothetical protein